MRLTHKYQSNFKDEEIITHALRCLEERMLYPFDRLNNSQDVKAYLRLHLAAEMNEVFAVLFLNNQKCLIAFEKLFHGTINEAVVYPRVVLQKALAYNAAAIILAHNHPSGECMPSTADIEITQTLQKVLKIIDISVLDHVIVSQRDSYSFAEHGVM
jgi:DNA repair protein RadC